jgi:hypothetical protein
LNETINAPHDRMQDGAAPDRRSRQVSAVCRYVAMLSSVNRLVKRNRPLGKTDGGSSWCKRLEKVLLSRAVRPPEAFGHLAA